MSLKIVCFDCDSTLSRVEGIDELAKKKGLGKEVEQLTDSAMNGEIPLEAVFERRLSLIQPDRSSIEQLAEQYIAELVEGACETIKELMEKGKQVCIISGGLRQAIIPLAEYLGLARENVHAVDIFFDNSGNYQGFDMDSPLARNGGKAEICRALSADPCSLAMIGDGQTDLESKQAGALFIGFGGVVERESVREQADIFVSGPSLQAVIQYIV